MSLRSHCLLASVVVCVEIHFLWCEQCTRLHRVPANTSICSKTHFTNSKLFLMCSAPPTCPTPSILLCSAPPTCPTPVCLPGSMFWQHQHKCCAQSRFNQLLIFCLCTTLHCTHITPQGSNSRRFLVVWSYVAKIPIPCSVRELRCETTAHAWLLCPALIVQVDTYSEKDLSNADLEQMVRIHLSYDTHDTCIYMYTYTRTHMRTHTHTHTHAHTRTHTHRVFALSPQPLSSRYKFCTALTQVLLEMDLVALFHWVSCTVPYTVLYTQTLQVFTHCLVLHYMCDLLQRECVQCDSHLKLSTCNTQNSATAVTWYTDTYVCTQQAANSW